MGVSLPAVGPHQHLTRLVCRSGETDSRWKSVCEALASLPSGAAATPSSTAVTWLYCGFQDRPALAETCPSGKTPCTRATYTFSTAAP